MNFFDSIIQNFSSEELSAFTGCRVLMFGDTAVYIEGVRAILSYSEAEISLSVKKGELIVKGEKLYLKKYCGGDLAVCGKITALERV